MPGIYIAAALTVALALGPIGAAIRFRIRPADRLFAVAGVIGGAAVFFGAYYLLRLPLDHILQPLLQGYPASYRLGATWYAPVTEEPAKWAVLVPLFLMGKVRQENIGAWAICLGFGFGIGEIVFLARVFAAEPQSLTIPWYLSSGFIVERLMVCFIHSALVLVAAESLCRQRLWWLLSAVVLHWLVNLPIFVARQFPLDDKGIVWGQLLRLWSTSFFVVALVYLGRHVMTSTDWTAAFLGKAVCHECQTLYVRPWWGINHPGRRYERCPQCKHYHWTTQHTGNSTR